MLVICISVSHLIYMIETTRLKCNNREQSKQCVTTRQEHSSQQHIIIRVVSNLTKSNKPDLAGFRNSNPAGAGTGFGENLFLDDRTIRLMKLVASTMLSAAVKKQYCSVFPLLHHCLTVNDEICGTAMNFVFFARVTVIKLANIPVDRSAVLSIIYLTFCSCIGIQQIWLEIWLEELDRISRKFQKNPDFGFAGAGAEMWCNS